MRHDSLNLLTNGSKPLADQHPKLSWTKAREVDKALCPAEPVGHGAPSDSSTSTAKDYKCTC